MAEFSTPPSAPEKLPRYQLYRDLFDEAFGVPRYDVPNPGASLPAELGQLRTDVDPELLLRTVVMFVNHSPELLDLREPTELDQRLDDALLLLRSVVAPPGASPG